MKISLKTKLTALICISAGIIALVALKISKGKTSTEKIKIVKPMNLTQRITIPGHVIPERKTIITAPFHGYVKKLYVQIGERVKKGKPLVSITQSLQSVDPVYPLRAPFTGTVVQIFKQEGEFVKPNDPRDYILRIDNLDTLYVVSDVPEIDHAKMKMGQKVIVKASAILNQTYEGVVEEISLAARPQDNWRKSQVEYPSKIRLVNPDKKVKPGMSVIADIITMKKNNVLALPHEFLIKKGQKYFVIQENGKRKKVKTGIHNESFIEITKGIKEGDKVQQVNFMKLLTEK